MKKLDIRLLRMILHSKGQFISVVVIIAAALSIYIMFNMTDMNIVRAVEYYYELTDMNDIQVQLTRIPEGALNELKSIKGVREVKGRISFDVPLRVANRDEKVGIRLISIPPTQDYINRLYFTGASGSAGGSAGLSPGGNSAILLEQFAKARGLKEGDIIKPYINGREFSLTVAGAASSPEFIYLMENDQSLLPAAEKFGVAYVDEVFAQSVFGYPGSYNELLITLKAGSRIDDTVDELEKKLDKYGLKRIIKRENQLSDSVLTQKMEGVEKMAQAIPVLFLAVAAIIIAIMLSRLVNNDRMAIGVLKALGFGNLSILAHYTKYSGAMGLAGAIAGIGGGLLLAGPMTGMFVFYFNVPVVKYDIYYSLIINALVLTGVFCIASGLFGSRSVLRIMPADSMRPEAPRSGKRILLERVRFFWRRLPFSWKLVVRNIMRNKRRFLFLVLGLSLTYAINTVPLFEGQAITDMFALQYGQYQKADYTVEFFKPMNENVINDLKHIIVTDRIEPKLEYPFELSNGWLRKSVNITGIPKDTAFYEFRDPDDKVVKLHGQGIFITEALARSLKLKAGDMVKVKNFLPGKQDIDIEVAGVVKQYLGLGAYMDITAMEQKLVEKQLITGVSIASEDNLKEKLRDVKNISAVRSTKDMQNAFLEFLDTIIAATRLYTVFGGILGFAIVYNASIISISERSMELASLRVMGFDKRDLFRMINRENSVMTVTALIFGVPLGIGMIRGIVQSFSSDMVTFPMILSPGIFIQAGFATVFFVAAAQLATLKKLYNLNFIDALKSRIS